MAGSICSFSRLNCSFTSRHYFLPFAHVVKASNRSRPGMFDFFASLPVNRFPDRLASNVSNIMLRNLPFRSFEVKRITTNPTNPYFILVTFRTCFFSLFSIFNDEKIKLQELQ